MAINLPYKSKSPVLFIIFNRPDITSRVFEKIKEAKPDRLYIASDGARKDNINDLRLCKEARNIIQNIDWKCEVKTLFREENLGCKYAVSSAITWFFTHEDEGIILEDDCLPSNDFFRFCDLMLEKYRNDTRVYLITGDNFQFGKKWGDASYYFSNNTHVWGWASWKRVWDKYDVHLNQYKIENVGEQLAKIFHDPLIIESWKDIFVSLKNHKIDTWDYQLGFTTFFNNGLSIIPNVNLVSNIGFRSDATHTHDDNNKYANIPAEQLEDIIVHPIYILPEKLADLFTWNLDLGLEQKRKQLRKKERSLKNIIKQLSGFK